MAVELRGARADDQVAIAALVDEWWGGRPLRALLQPLFLEHFSSSSLVAEDGGAMVGFLVGFLSPDHPGEAYVHFVGVHPERRGESVGAALHDRFAEQVAAHGVRTVRCVTSPVNAASVRFHIAIGFRVDGRDDELVRMSRDVDVLEPRFVVRPDERPEDEAFPRLADRSWPIAPGTVLRGATVELSISDPDGDAADMFAALDHDEVWAHVWGRPAGVEAMGDLLRGRLAMPGWCPWTVRLRRSLGGFEPGTTVGTTSLLDVVPADARGEIGATMYAPAVWASAVNPECKLLLMTHAFEVLGWGPCNSRPTSATTARSERSPGSAPATRVSCAVTSGGPTRRCATRRCSR